jgi:hypothetical protein
MPGGECSRGGDGLRFRVLLCTFDELSPSMPEGFGVGRCPNHKVGSTIESWEDIDVPRTRFSMESKNLDLGRTDHNWGNASLLRAGDVGCLDHLCRPVWLSSHNSPHLVSYLVSSGPCQPAGIGMDRGACEELRSRSLTPFTCSLTSLSRSRCNHCASILLFVGRCRGWLRARSRAAVICDTASALTVWRFCRYALVLDRSCNVQTRFEHETDLCYRRS